MAGISVKLVVDASEVDAYVSQLSDRGVTVPVRLDPKGEGVDPVAAARAAFGEQGTPPERRPFGGQTPSGGFPGAVERQADSLGVQSVLQQVAAAVAQLTQAATALGQNVRLAQPSPETGGDAGELPVPAPAVPLTPPPVIEAAPSAPATVTRAEIPTIATASLAGGEFPEVAAAREPAAPVYRDFSFSEPRPAALPETGGAPDARRLEPGGFPAVPFAPSVATRDVPPAVVSAPASTTVTGPSSASSPANTVSERDTGNLLAQAAQRIEAAAQRFSGAVGQFGAEVGKQASAQGQGAGGEVPAGGEVSPYDVAEAEVLAAGPRARATEILSPSDVVSPPGRSAVDELLASRSTNPRDREVARARNAARMMERAGAPAEIPASNLLATADEGEGGEGEAAGTRGVAPRSGRFLGAFGRYVVPAFLIHTALAHTQRYLEQDLQNNLAEQRGEPFAVYDREKSRANFFSSVPIVGAAAGIATFLSGHQGATATARQDADQGIQAASAATGRFIESRTLADRAAAIERETDRYQSARSPSGSYEARVASILNPARAARDSFETGLFAIQQRTIDARSRGANVEADSLAAEFNLQNTAGRDAFNKTYKLATAQARDVLRERDLAIASVNRRGPELGAAAAGDFGEAGELGFQRGLQDFVAEQRERSPLLGEIAERQVVRQREARRQEQQSSVAFRDAGTRAIGLEQARNPIEARAVLIRAEAARQEQFAPPAERESIRSRAFGEESLARQQFAEDSESRRFSIRSETRRLNILGRQEIGSSTENRGTRSALADVQSIIDRTEGERRQAIVSGHPELVSDIAERGRAGLIAFRQNIDDSVRAVSGNPLRVALSGIGTFNQHAVDRRIRDAFQSVGGTSVALPPEYGGPQPPVVGQPPVAGTPPEVNDSPGLIEMKAREAAAGADPSQAQIYRDLGLGPDRMNPDGSPVLPVGSGGGVPPRPPTGGIASTTLGGAWHAGEFGPGTRLGTIAGPMAGKPIPTFESPMVERPVNPVVASAGADTQGGGGGEDSAKATASNTEGLLAAAEQLLSEMRKITANLQGDN